jgi:hypothetical protein
MKININIDAVSSGKISGQSINTGPKNIEKPDLSREKSSATLQNLAQKKTFVDAVIITQIAQDFFQKAILISSKLKSLASEALTTGKLKEHELNDTLKDISTLNNIQDGFTAVSSVQNNANLNRVGVINQVPQIQMDDINSLRQFANELSSRNIDLKKIDRISENLTNKASAADKSFKQLISKLSVHGSMTAESVVKYPELSQNTVSQIAKYPENAIKSQGNINYEAVKNLL